MTTTADYALLSLAGYPRTLANAGPPPQGWVRYMERFDPASDFAAFAFYNPATNEVVISYAGTDLHPTAANPENIVKDWIEANLAAAIGAYSPQVWQAIKFYADVRAQLTIAGLIPESTPITLVGHSLGGGLASIVSVLFDQQARVFDEAPFENTVRRSAPLTLPNPEAWLTSSTVMRYFEQYDSYQEQSLRSTDSAFREYADAQSRLTGANAFFAEREANVHAWHIDGEVLELVRLQLVPGWDSVFPTIQAFDIERPIAVSGPSAAVRLHSMALLTARELSPAFAGAMDNVPPVFDLLFDETLYARGDLRNDPSPDFLMNLVRNQVGVEGVPNSNGNGLLDSFAGDIQGLIDQTIDTPISGSQRVALIAGIFDYYYWGDFLQSAVTPDSFVRNDGVTGGFVFDFTLISGDPTQELGRQRMVASFVNLLDDYRPGSPQVLLNQAERWFIQNGAGPLSAEGGGSAEVFFAFDGQAVLQGMAGNDILVGGIGNDILYGGNDSDVLIGSFGMDVLDGGAGLDYLSGGADDDSLSGGSGVDTLDGGSGTDTYFVVDAAGNFVTIRDSDGLGSVSVQGGSGSHALAAGLESVPGSPGAWRTANGDRWALAGSSVLIRLSGGGYVMLEDFASGDLGIVLPGPLAALPPAPNPSAPNYYVDASGPHGGLLYGFYNNSYYESPAVYNASVTSPENIDLTAATPAAGLSSIGAFGGFGDSRIVGSPYGDWLFDDTSFAAGQYISIGNDVGNDVLIGGGGNDWLEARGGDDELYGGEGNDFLFDLPLASAGAYDDVSWVRAPGHSSNDRMYGEGGADIITAAGGSAHIDGGVGDDELYGGQDDDVLLGGDGNDVLGGDTRLNAGVGQFLLPLGQDPTYTLNGQWVEDTTNPGIDTLDGGAGNDILLGGGLSDVMNGGADDDVLQGDTLFVPGGTRALFANHGTTPVALHGNDRLFGGSGIDWLYGGGGEDWLFGGTGNDVLFGDDDPQRAGTLDAAHHRRDHLFGDEGDDLLYGNGGDDELDGGDGADFVYGGAGHDTLHGGAGVDHLVGDDSAADAGNDEIHGGDDDDQLFGLSGDDRLYGDAGADQLMGGDGNDLLEGGDGHDALFGQGGNDTLRGGLGLDELSGGDGDDVLEAGTGDALFGGDLLFGDAGNDRFVLGLGSGDVQITDTVGTNRLVFGSGVGASQVSVSMSSGLVFIDYSPTDYAFMDVATFERLAAIEFADGSALDPAEVRQRFTPGATPDGELTLTSGSVSSVVVYRRGDDLVISQANAAPGWLDTSTLSARNVMFESGSGTNYGLAATTQVLVLNGWYRADANFYINTLVDQIADTLNLVAASWTAETLVYGSASADYLVGSETVDLLIGSDGADALDGRGGDDELDGGARDDTLHGGAGNDTYRFDVGDGADLVLDEAGADDVIRFGPGITSANLTVTESAAGLQVQVGPSANGDSLLILNWSQGGGQSIDRFAFEGGASLNRTQIDALNTGNHSPRVATTVGEQLARAGQAFSFAVPSGVFSDADAGDVLTLAARLTTGASLPGWLSFDPVTGTFSGTPTTTDGGTLLVQLEGTDSGGLSSVTEFAIRVATTVVLTGTAGADYLQASTTDDHEIYGLAGHDDLIGGNGNDRLVGGPGNDELQGVGGSDEYVYNRGDGYDDILQYDTNVASIDRLRFGPGILPTDLTLRSTGGNLYIDVRNAAGVVEGRLTLLSHLTSEAIDRKLDEIVFDSAPGVVWTTAQFEQQAMTPTSGDDYIRGTVGADAINGLGGNDEIFGLDGNDTLLGGAGADDLEGGAGDDILRGGPDYDVLVGGAGNDTYLIARGDGEDSISGTGALATDLDTLQFSAGIAPGDVRVTGQYGGGLRLEVADAVTGEVVNRISFNGQNDLAVDRVLFADAPSVVWSIADLRAASLIGDDAGNLLEGFAGADVLRGFGGDDLLRGYAGNDDLDGGSGADQLLGGDGDDIYRFSLGNATDEAYDSSGNDRIVLGAGITPTDVTLYRTSSAGRLHTSDSPATADALVIAINGTSDQMWVESFFDASNARRIEQIEFASGLVWDTATILANVVDQSGVQNAQSGTTGNDTFTVDHRGDTISEVSGGGIDTVYASVHFALPNNVENLTLTGGSLNLAGTGNSLANTLVGNAGANYLDGGTGIDTMLGGAGDDSYAVESGGGTFASGWTNFQDLVQELPGGGNDTILVSSYSATIPVNVENLILVGNQTGTVSYSPGTDLRRRFIGNELDNTIDLSRPLSVVTLGGAGTLLDGGVGADRLVGSVHSDDYVVDNAGDVVVEPLFSGGVDSVYASVTFALPRFVENLYLTGTGPINGFGNDRNNLLDGTANAASNVLAGGTGDDTYRLGAGDTVSELPGEGRDRVVITSGPVQIYGLDGYANVEDLELAAALLQSGLVGNDGANELVGNYHANSLDGGGGDDILDGGDGNDSLLGGAGNDWLYGGGDDDAYLGFGTATGTDVIEDEGGTDVIRFAAGQVTSIGQLQVVRVGNDLRISLDAANSITVYAWYQGTQYVVERMELVDAGLVYGYSGTQLQGLADGVNTAPEINAWSTYEFVEATTLFSYQLPANAFVDTQSQQTLAYTATMTDGSPLPSWLGFDAQTRTFTGTPPVSSVGTIGVRVTVTDGGSLTTHADFTLEVQPAVLWGTDGDDTLTGDANDNVVVGLAGNDVLLGLDGSDSLDGGEGDDALYGGTGNDGLYGDVGNDLLDGGPGQDEMYGYIGDDIYVVDDVADYVLEDEGEGTDTVQASITYSLAAEPNLENLTLTGTAAINGTGNTLDNLLTGNSGNNTLTGGAGNDTLDGGTAGTDSLRGGTGDDIYIVARTSGITITENANEGTDLVRASVTYTLGSNLENLTLTGTAAINGTGNSLANVITGNSGNNALSGGTGADALIGGAGNDTYTVDNVGDAITELAGEGTDLVNAAVSYTLANHVENLTLTGTTTINGTGNALDNVLTGNSGNNTLTGGAGNDTLDGGSGSDTMAGGQGNDTYVVAQTGDVVTELAGEGIDLVQSSIAHTLASNVENLTLTGSGAINGTGNALDNVLTGNSGSNTLTGSDGNDTLSGGTAGTDALRGGIGNDTYVVGRTSGITITENANEGTDLVQSSVTYTLGSNLENLTLTGTTAINGTGNTLNNTLVGNGAVNTLSGGTGADVLIGNAGNDTLTGGNGADTYRYASGDGADVVNDAGTDGASDLLDFTNLAFSQVTLARSTNDLLITRNGSTTDSVRVTNWFTVTGNQIETVRFTDQSLTNAQINSMHSSGLFSAALDAEVERGFLSLLGAIGSFRGRGDVVADWRTRPSEEATAELAVTSIDAAVLREGLGRGLANHSTYHVA